MCLRNEINTLVCLEVRLADFYLTVKVVKNDVAIMTSGCDSIPSPLLDITNTFSVFNFGTFYSDCFIFKTISRTI